VAELLEQVRAQACDAQADVSSSAGEADADLTWGGLRKSFPSLKKERRFVANPTGSRVFVAGPS
jgi:hypothetical protein